MRNSGYEKWTPSEVSDQLDEIGLGSYGSEFVKNDIYGEVLPMLEEKHLKSMGMTKIGHRIAFIRFVNTLIGAKEGSQADRAKQNSRPSSSLTKKEPAKPERNYNYDNSSDSEDQINYQRKPLQPQKQQTSKYDEIPKPTLQSKRQNPYASTRNQPMQQYGNNSDNENSDNDDEQETYYQRQKRQMESRRTPQQTSSSARKPPYSAGQPNRYDDSDSDDRYGYNNNYNKRPTPSRKAPTSMYGNGAGMDDDDDDDAGYNRRSASSKQFMTSRSNDRFQQPRPASRNQQNYQDEDSDDGNDNDNYYGYRQMQSRQQQAQSQRQMMPQQQQPPRASSRNQMQSTSRYQQQQQNLRSSYGYGQNSDDDNEDENSDDGYGQQQQSYGRMRYSQSIPQQNHKNDDMPEEYPDSDAENSLVQCRYCGRHFGQDRIAQHEAICQKSQKSKKKVFDSSKMRLKGTEAANYAGKSDDVEPKKKKTGVPKYKLEHDQLVAAIRAGRMQAKYDKDIAEGKNVPPPELPKYELINDTRVECPVCGRKFSEDALKRHLPSCERSHQRAGRR